MKTKVLALVIALISISAQAQTFDEVIKRVYEQYSAKKPLHFKTTYNLYKTFEANTAHQSYDGVFYKNESHDVYMKINETEILSNKEVSVKVSHPEKAVLLTPAEVNMNQEYDLSKFLDVYDRGKFVNHNTHWEIELVAKQLSNLPYAKIVLEINKNYFIKKQTFFYNSGVNFSDDYKKSEVHRPRLEISYKGYERSKVQPNQFQTSQFLKVDKSGKIVLTNGLNAYELFDRR